MSIVSSSIIEDRVQADGRRRIRERHTDHLGVNHDEHTYLCEAGFDANAALAAYVPIKEAQLRDSEIALNLTKAYAGQTNFTLNHSNGNQNATVWREEFKRLRDQTNPIEQIKLAAMHYSFEQYRVATGMTDNQIKNLFGFTNGQVATWRQKLVDVSSQYLAILALVGD